MKPDILRLTILLSFSILSASCTKPYIVRPEAASYNVTSLKTIYVAGHGWHTGLIVPAKEISEEMPVLKNRFGVVPYFEFGWGDAGFYQAEKITSGLALKAIFRPTDTVLHVVAVSEEPAEYFSHSEVIKIPVTKEEYDSLRKFIRLSFGRDSDGNVRPSDRGKYGESQFYRAEGNYFLANTCNKWTAKALKSAGQDISVMFKLTAGSIMNYLRHAGFSETTPMQ